MIQLADPSWDYCPSYQGMAKRLGAVLALLLGGCGGGIEGQAVPGGAQPTDSPGAGVPAQGADPAAPDGPVSSDPNQTGSGGAATAGSNPTDTTGDSSATGDASSSTCDPNAAIDDPGPALSQRLTRTEYDNTVRDLLGDTTAPATGFPAEELSLNFDNNPSVLTVSPLLAENYMNAAGALAAAAAQDLGSLVPCDAAQGQSCAEQFIQSFGEKVFRRPITADDVAVFLGPFNTGAAVSFENGIRLVIDAMLQSASFLYRLEYQGSTVDANLIKPTSYEMASRLSYFLWNSTPDEALLSAAAADALSTPEQIAEQARRMLQDPRARAMVVDFHDQWLNLKGVPTLQKDPEVYPDFTEQVAADMHTEAVLFIEDVLYNSGGDVGALFSADYTFLNQNLSSFYGVGGVTGTDFQRVALDTSRTAGFLTLGATMSVFGKPNQSDPVHRGKFVREQLLCDPPPPPPPSAMVEVPQPEPNLTTRERFQQHSEDPACSGCHSLMDPIGVALENYDGVGRWRDTENGKPIDPSGQLTGTDVPDPFVGPAALGDNLAQSAQAKACMVKNWFRYAMARVDSAADACALSDLEAQFAASNYDITELLVALTQTDAFLYRRAM